MKHLIPIDIPEGDTCRPCCFMQILYHGCVRCVNPHIDMIIKGNLFHEKSNTYFKPNKCKETYK